MTEAPEKASSSLPVIVFVAVAICLAMAYGYFIEPQMLLVNRYDVRCRGLAVRI